MDKGLYLYAIGRCDGSLSDVSGIDGIDPNYMLEPLATDNLIALVSYVPLSEFGSEALKNNLQDISWLDKSARTHNTIVKQLHDVINIIPVRFGTVFYSKDGALQFLKNNESCLLELLDKIDGFTEMGVPLYFDRSAIIKHLTEQDPRLSKLEYAGTGNKTGTSYLLQKRIESQQAAEFYTVIDQYVESAIAELAPKAKEVYRAQTAPVPNSNSLFYVNIAYLVATEELEPFKQAAARWQEMMCEKGVTARVTGPWPPYSFTNELHQSGLEG